VILLARVHKGGAYEELLRLLSLARDVVVEVRAVVLGSVAPVGGSLVADAAHTRGVCVQFSYLNTEPSTVAAWIQMGAAWLPMLRIFNNHQKTLALGLVYVGGVHLETLR
jgi:hypothetical protein